MFSKRIVYFSSGKAVTLKKHVRRGGNPPVVPHIKIKWIPGNILQVVLLTKS